MVLDDETLFCIRIICNFNYNRDLIYVDEKNIIFFNYLEWIYPCSCKKSAISTMNS